MKKIQFANLLFIFVWAVSCCPQKTDTGNLRLWYKQPAEKWVEALPVGNGRVGAMVFGGVPNEQIQFNEETLWAGGPHDYAHAGACKYLPEIRNLLSEGKQKEAEELAEKTFMSEPLRQMDYQPFGDILVHFPGHENYSDYRRELSLQNAEVNVSYSVDGVKFSREYLVSQPQQVLAAHFSSGKRNALSFSVKLASPHQQRQIEISSEGSEIHLQVKIENGILEGYSILKIVQEGGSIKVEGDSVKVENASQASLFLAAATSFVNPGDVSGNSREKCRETIETAAGFSFDEIRKLHLAEYQPYFNRFSVEFGDSCPDTIPTGRRIVGTLSAPDPQLAALYMQYARYLLISGSRPGTYPVNLQGIWNQDIKPAWGSKYTVNINTEMNYWPAEALNLSDCHSPLFTMIDEVAKTGQNTAREHYNARGWVLHHNTDLWRGTAPINASNHGIWVVGGAWLCHHLWEHYLFTGDKEFLKRYYPVIRDAALFFTDFLVKDEKTGWLISTPSNSPENGGLVAGPTMDHAIIRSLFKLTAEAAGILETDLAFRDTLNLMIPQIAPFRIGKYGQLQEWLEDKDDPQNKHRHVSHLWAIYPGSEITWEKSPELMEAAKQSLLFRGDEGTGWSLAWKINFWARLKDGEHAWKMVNMLLGPAEYPGRKIRGGSYPNLFDAHPPFQIDGNFGGAAGIAEMLVQSHQNQIELLPALPNAISSGKIRGMRARGGFELDFAWENSQVVSLTVKSLAGNHLRIKFNNEIKESDTTPGQIITLK